jgi:hypothetical protein
MLFLSFPRSVVLTVHGMDERCTYSPGVLGAEHFTLPSGFVLSFLDVQIPAARWYGERLWVEAHDGSLCLTRGPQICSIHSKKASLENIIVAFAG